MIHTSRLLIRRFQEQGYRSLFEYLSNPLIYRFEPGEPISLEDAKQLALTRANGSDFWAVILKGTQELAGHLYFKQTEPQDLNITVDWDLLIQRMKENLNSYWLRWANRLGRRLVLLSDWGIQWTVLGVLRQYYTFREDSITTKIRAGKYALNVLPTPWHPLIREAIHIREGNRHSLYRSKILRMMETVKFSRYVIQTCNANF